VTIPLQFFVKDSRLALPRCSKSLLLGFYDVTANPSWLLSKAAGAVDTTGAGGLPGPKQMKAPAQLYVRYRRQKCVYELTVDDLQPLTLPADDDLVSCLGSSTSVAA
jgi:hypothetical protein